MDKFTSIEDALAFIGGVSWKKSQLGLSRIARLLELSGDPHKKLKFIHIAGTNGKGSTAAMLASILREAGYKTGLFISPSIQKVGERIQIDGVPIADNEIMELAEYLCELTAGMPDPATEFELFTAIAMLHFLNRQCGIVVLEVGLGGRLDATNVIGAPEVAVITSIGLDHTAELGGTIEKIAAEKAGIIKPGGSVVSYPQEVPAERVLREICEERKARICFVDGGAIRPIGQGFDGQRFDFKNLQALAIPLLGRHQLYNAAVAITAIEIMRERGWHISENALRNGLHNARWPGRFEVMLRKPAFIIDGAHNPQGVQAAVDCLGSMFPSKKITFMLGVLADKDYAAMVDIIMPYAKRVITVTPASPRALPADSLADYIRGRFCTVAASGEPAGQGMKAVDVASSKSVEQGIEAALEDAGWEDVICALGSLYFIGKARDCLQSTRGEYSE